MITLSKISTEPDTFAFFLIFAFPYILALKESQAFPEISADSKTSTEPDTCALPLTEARP